MYAKELIGKNCIRTKPVIKERYAKVGGGFLGYGATETKIKEPDYYHCTEPVKIIAATDHNIVCERKSIGGESFTVNLDERYCDDAWTDYDELLKGHKPEESEGGADEQEEVQERKAGHEPG